MGLMEINSVKVQASSVKAHVPCVLVHCGQERLQVKCVEHVEVVSPEGMHRPEIGRRCNYQMREDNGGSQEHSKKLFERHFNNVDSRDSERTSLVLS